MAIRVTPLKRRSTKKRLEIDDANNRLVVRKTKNLGTSGHPLVLVNPIRLQKPNSDGGGAASTTGSTNSLLNALDYDWIVIRSCATGRWAPAVLRTSTDVPVNSVAHAARAVRASIGAHSAVKAPTTKDKTWLDEEMVELITPVAFVRANWHQDANHEAKQISDVVKPANIDSDESDADDEAAVSSWGVDTGAGQRSIRWERRRRRARRPLRAVHVMADVLDADMTLTDSNAVVAEELTLDALGIDSGDEVYLTSARLDSKGNYVIIRKAVKAYAETELMRTRRAEIEKRDQKGDKLPNIWIGRALREQLGVSYLSTDRMVPPRDKTSAVVISPSRSYALVKNLRELAIVLSLSVLGFKDWIQAWFPNEFWRPAGLLVAFGIVVPLSMLFYRVRALLR